MRKFLCLLVLFPALHLAAAPKPSSQPAKGVDMDYGPFLSYSVLKPRPPLPPGVKPSLEKHKNGDPAPPWKPGELLATKGVTVKLGDAAICFDTDTCRYAGGWTGGFVDVSQSNLTRNQGPWPVIAKGELIFSTEDGPGWAKGASFKDPRHANSDPRMKNGEGPLPRDWAHYRGLYRSGERVVFEYTVGDVRVLDCPGVMKLDGVTVLTRTLLVEPHATPLRLLACAAEAGEAGAPDANGIGATIRNGNLVMTVSLIGMAPGVKVVGGSAATDPSRIEVSIAPAPHPMSFTIAIATDSGKVSAKLLQPRPPFQTEAIDVTAMIKGGPALWKEEIETSGTIASDTAAYVIDTVALPDQNPWKSWIKPTGFDFFPDGRAAVCTFNGDVWVVSGLDAKLNHVKWKRFATGLYEPLGLKIVDGDVYVLDRAGITKLHDLNHDGEADFYENFNSDLVSDANYHSFHMDLQTDSEGNFYYAVCGNQMPLANPHQGCIVKVSKYGDKAEVYSTGLRAANGLGSGPNDEITVADNQGHWVPASPIFRVKSGAFYGYHGDPRRVSQAEFTDSLERRPKNDLPICWVPYKWDNSSGGQVWAGKNFGPYSGQMLHLSYGTCSVFAVLSEHVGEVEQAGVVQIPGKFDSGAMRGRVSPTDGQVWVCGIKGWQNNAAKDGCFHRLRYTGKASYLPTELHMTTAGARVTFPVELDPETATDAGSYSFEAWGFHVSEKYGSDDYKISDPNAKGRDSLDVRKATLSPDKRSVLIDVAGLGPATQYVLRMNLSAADGKKIKCDLGGSIWKLGAEK